MKGVFKLLVVPILGIIFGVLGWLLGAYIGGNYAVDFVFNGVRGYEAVGQLGFIFGLIGGGLLCWWIVFRPSRRKKYQE